MVKQPHPHLFKGSMSKLSVFVPLTLMLLVTSIEVSGQRQYITGLVQSPDGALVTDVRVTFTCQAMVSNVSWIVGGVRLDTAANDGFQITNNHTSQGSIASVLSTRAKGDLNNTNITCVAIDSGGSNIIDRQTIIMVLAAPPLPPFLRLSLFTNGTTIRVEWDRPFTLSGFPVTSYTLDIVNKTSGRNNKIILEQNLSDVVIHDLVSSGVPTSCHTLSFSVLATNAIGDSSPSNIETSGFPIFPRTSNVVLHVDVTSSTSPALLTVTFQPPEICAFQEPPTYTVGIFDSEGEEIVLTQPKVTANSSRIEERIEATLETGQFYSAELTIQHQNVPGEAFITFIGINYNELETRPTEFTTTTGKGASLSNFFARKTATAISIMTLIICLY